MLYLELFRENLLLQIRQLVWEGVYFILYLSSRAVMEMLPCGKLENAGDLESIFPPHFTCIHSSSLSYDTSKASSKASFPHSAILTYLVKKKKFEIVDFLFLSRLYTF